MKSIRGYVMPENKQYIVDRRKPESTPMRTIFIGVAVPLIVAIVFGYVAMHSTLQRLTLIAEQNDRRLTMIEETVKMQDKVQTELRIALAQQTQILDYLYNRVMGEGTNGRGHKSE